MDIRAASLALHYRLQGKLEMVSRCPIQTQEDLSLAYTPGVAAPCLEIQKDPALSFQLTRRRNLVAVITDGSAVLGLGDIGPLAGMPVMEGKCVLFKEFAGVDAVPLCVDTQDVEEMVQTIALISKSFGGINLEDIAAPRCFEIERKLKEKCDIPVFHDDQHGTAIIALAGLTNALRVVGKRKEDVKVVFSGAGSAAISITKLLLQAGFRDITLCDKFGALYEGNPNMNWAQQEIAKRTNLEKKQGTLADLLVGADVFIGVSAPGAVTKEMVQTMNAGAVIFACANPTPEITYEEAMASRPDIIFATGRSDYPNQVNNVLAFPYLFRGALDVYASTINDEMKLAVTHALARLAKEPVPQEVLKTYGLKSLSFGREYLIPKPSDPRLLAVVATAVARAAIESGVARREIEDWDAYAASLTRRVKNTK